MNSLAQTPTFDPMMRTDAPRSSRVIRLLEARFAGRSIDRHPLPETTINTLQEAVRLTPSGYNKQPWRYLFAISGEARGKVLAGMNEKNRAWAQNAPLLVVGTARREDGLVHGEDGRAYYQFDLGMSAMNLMLAATELGLVARPLSGFDPAAIRDAFGLEDDREPWIMLAIGLPGTDQLDEAGTPLPQPRSRHAADEVVRVM